MILEYNYIHSFNIQFLYVVPLRHSSLDNYTYTAKYYIRVRTNSVGVGNITSLDIIYWVNVAIKRVPTVYSIIFLYKKNCLQIQEIIRS